MRRTDVGGHQYHMPLNSLQNTSPTALQAQGGTSLQDHMVFSMATGVVSLTSRASMTVLVIGGVVCARSLLFKPIMFVFHFIMYSYLLTATDKTERCLYWPSLTHALLAVIFWHTNA